MYTTRDHHARAPATAICLAGLLCLAGCDGDRKAPPPQPAPRPSAAAPTADGGRSVGPQAVLARSGPYRVAVTDFKQASRRALLLAPERVLDDPALRDDPSRLASPSLQLAAVRQLLEQQVVEAEAQARGLRVAPAEVARAIADDPALSRFVAGPGGQPPRYQLEALGLEREDLEEVARQRLVRQRLQQALLGSIEENELRQAWRVARDTRDLLVVSLPNTPSSQTLDQFVAEEREAIRQRHRERPELYRTPRSVILTMLRAPRGQETRLEQAAARLAEERGADAAAVATELGLEHVAGARLVRKEDPRAWRAEAGATGVTVDGPRGSYAWRVEGHRAPEALALSPGLEREIAAELLRERGVVPVVRGRLESALAAMEQALGREPDRWGEAVDTAKLEALVRGLEGRGLEVRHTGPFGRGSGGQIPGLGLVEPLARQSLEGLDPTKGERVVGPLTSRERAYVARLVASQRPDEGRWEEERAAFREEFMRSLKPRVVDDFAASVLSQQEVEMDLEPLRRMYGRPAKLSQ